MESIVDNWHVDLGECYSKNETIAQEISFNPNYLETELAKDLNACYEKLDLNCYKNSLGFTGLIEYENLPIDVCTNLKKDYMLSQISNDLETCSETINESILNDYKFVEDFKVISNVSDDNIDEYMEMGSSLSLTSAMMMQQPSNEIASSTFIPLKQHPVASKDLQILTELNLANGVGPGRPKKDLEEARRELIAARNTSVPEEVIRIERNYASIKYRRKRNLEEYSYEKELMTLQNRNEKLQKQYEKYAIRNENIRKMISYNIKL